MPDAVDSGYRLDSWQRWIVMALLQTRLCKQPGIVLRVRLFVDVRRHEAEAVGEALHSIAPPREAALVKLRKSCKAMVLYLATGSKTPCL